MLQFVLGLIPFLPLKPLHPLSVLVASHEFDSEQIPDLTKDIYIQDIHCVGSLCKLYFRELPNPLLTYQLYEKFSVSAAVGHFPLQWGFTWQSTELLEAGPALHTFPSVCSASLGVFRAIRRVCHQNSQPDTAAHTPDSVLPFQKGLAVPWGLRGLFCVPFGPLRGAFVLCATLCWLHSAVGPSRGSLAHFPCFAGIPLWFAISQEWD